MPMQGRPKPKAAEARALGPQNILIFLSSIGPKNLRLNSINTKERPDISNFLTSLTGCA
jgi:hypothetical protein